AFFLDYGRTDELITNGEARAVVHGRLDEGVGLGKPHRAASLDGRLSAARTPLQDDLASRDGRADGNADVDELDRHVGRRERELFAVGHLERLRERAPRRVRVVPIVRAVRAVAHAIEALAQEPAVGEPLEARGVELETRVAHDGARLVLE